MHRVVQIGANGSGLRKVTAAALAVLLVPAVFYPVLQAEARSSYTKQGPSVAKLRDGSPVLLLVSIKKQRIHAYDASGEIAQSRVSTGKPGFDTPTGVFSILQKKVFHRSNLYNDAPMPHMQRLTWSGVALHAGVVPGYRASHGCVRLPASFARSLFGVTGVGSRVIVTPEELQPIPFSSPKLFKPLPAENPKAYARYRATKVASNDRGTQGLREFPRLFGITPALAEAAREPDAFLPNRPRSRAEARRIKEARLTKLKDAISDAENAKKEASERVQAAAKESKALAPKVEEANQVLAKLRDAIKVAEKEFAATRIAFETFHSGTKAQPGNKPALSEKALEQAILDSRIDLDEARADLVRAQLEFSTLLGAAPRVEQAKKNAIADVEQEAARISAAKNDLDDFNKQSKRDDKNISVFISLKAQRIYIRMGQEPLLQAPIAVHEPDRRYGTHVFTAMGYDETGNEFDWRLVSAQLPKATYFDDDDDRRGKKRKRRQRTQTMPYSEGASIRQANIALDAFTIPSDIEEIITERAKPGTSLIVSDHELPPNENGLGTEFVVLTR